MLPLFMYLLFLLSIVLLSLLFIPYRLGFEDLDAKYQDLAAQITNLQYHPPEQQIQKANDFVQNTTEIVTDQGDRIQIPLHKTQGTLLYYEPGTHKYTHYVPDYEQSVRLQAMVPPLSK